MTYRVSAITCRRCRETIRLPVTMDSDMIPHEEDGIRAIPPFHPCEPKEPEPEHSPFDSESFVVMKATQHVMSPVETQAMLKRLGPLGENLLLKALSIN